MLQESLIVHMTQRQGIRRSITSFKAALFHSAILLLCVGCASEPLQLPECEIPGPSPEIAVGVSVPEMPSAVSQTEDTATFDRAGIVTLTQVRISADTNSTIARENALAIEARNEEVNQLIECARYSKIWMEVREDMLDQERKDHQIDNLWHRGVIVLGLIAVTL